MKPSIRLPCIVNALCAAALLGAMSMAMGCSCRCGTPRPTDPDNRPIKARDLGDGAGGEKLGNQRRAGNEPAEAGSQPR